MILLALLAVSRIVATNALAAPEAPQASGPLFFSLDQAVERALAANRGLGLAADAVEGRRLALQAAAAEFETKFVPAVGASVYDSGAGGDTGRTLALEGALARRFSSGLVGSAGPRVVRNADDSYTAGVGFSLDVPLFRGFGRAYNRSAVDASTYALRSAERTRFLSRVRTVLDCVATVYDIVELNDLADLYRAQVARYTSHAATARVKERAGLAGPLDVYRAEIVVKDAEDALGRTRQQLAAAEDRLKLLLALPLSRAIALSAPRAPDPVSLAPEDALEIARAHRVELDQARDRLDEALRQARVARENILPSVSLVVDYERAGSDADLDRSWTLDEDVWRISLSGGAAWPRTAEKTAWQQSLLGVRGERVNFEIQEEEITRDVRAQLANLKKAADSIAIREAQIVQAEGKLALAEVKFRHAMADNFNVIEAENELAGARGNLLSARTDYIVGTYALRAALGTLLEHPPGAEGAAP